MGKIIDLGSYKTRNIKDRIYSSWCRRFEEDFDLATSIMELSDRTLYMLAMPGEEADSAFYELIYGCLDMADELSSMDSALRIKLVDIHMTLVDLVRFEMMHRLGWIKEPSFVDLPIVEVIGKTGQVKEYLSESPPELSSSYPGYDQYLEMNPRDRGGFIRKQLTDALSAFRDARIKN